MNLQQWDLVMVRIDPQDRDEHPAIILSPTEVASDRQWPKVNVIYGSTKRPATKLLPGQLLLDAVDGCEHLTVFDCVFFPVVRKEQVSRVLGQVSANRRRPLHQTLSASLRLFQ